jgi:hypothetical protein
MKESAAKFGTASWRDRTGAKREALESRRV